MVFPGAKKKPDAARMEALAMVQEQFRDFDVVWAKVHGFPWWPGVLFYSWDVVQRAGIRTDAKLMQSLVVPLPDRVPVLDADGQETGSFRLRRFCLVMFLDKFNFSVVEIDPRSVASYTVHYQVYVHAVMGRKHAKKTDFRRALQQADKLLHMGEPYDEEDLVMLEEPSPAEKKQRLEVATEGQVEEDAASLEDAWDDRETGDDAAFSVEESEEIKEEAAKKKPRRPVKTKAPAKKAADRKQNGKRAHAQEAVTTDDDSDVIMLETPSKVRRKAPAKETKPRARKASRKEGGSLNHVAVVSPSPSPIDLTVTPESEHKGRSVKSKAKGKALGRPPKAKKTKQDTDAEPKKRKRGPAKVLELESDADERMSDADDEREAQHGELVLTPLSSIWTTSVPTQDGNGTHPQLAYQQDFVWDDAVFTDELSIAEKEKAALEQEQADIAAANGVTARASGKRQSRSVHQSHIRQNLMSGNLDPHTMVQCAAYLPKGYVEDPNSRSRGGPTLDPPFQVVVHPDAVFVADLHAHLATCEIIGFLGGKWDGSSKTLYIQAAFPCRSLVIDGDDGSTDVEMDPGSEIELRSIIENAHLEVVGWYHSHPAFAPDPSVRDIENQTSYQQLFQRPNFGKGEDKEERPSEPFVGLIVGTYDTRRSSPVSLFRYFHTRGEKVSGGALREIYMPYEFIPDRRHFRSVLADEKRQKSSSLSMYPSVLKCFHMTQSFIKPEEIQSAVTRTTPSRRSRPSPSRVKTHGPTRKRKQSADVLEDKPSKKSKPKSKRSIRSPVTVIRDVELIEDIDDSAEPSVEPSESANPSSSPTNAVAKLQSSSLPLETKSSVKADVASFATATEAASKTNDSKTDALEKTRDECGNTAVEGSLADPRTHTVENDVEVVADVVAATLDTVGTSNKRKRSRKSHTPQRRMENSEQQLPLGFDKPSPAEVHQQDEKKGSSDSSGDLSSNQPPLASGSRPCASPAASVSSSSSSGRKRNRKPRKTVKKGIPSTCVTPPGPSPRRSPSPSNTFFGAFQASGPRISGAGYYQDSYPDVAQQVNRMDGPKPETLATKEMKYVVVEEGDIDMEVPPASQFTSDAQEDSKDDLKMKAEKQSVDGSLHGTEPMVQGNTILNGQVGAVPVEPEVREFVVSLVERVVADCVPRVAQAVVKAFPSIEKLAQPASGDVLHGKLSAQGAEEGVTATPTSDSLVDKSAVKVETKSEPVVVEPSIKKQKSASSGAQLFGSNRECEDIQTSLQKMATYLEKLKGVKEPQADAVAPVGESVAADVASNSCQVVPVKTESEVVAADSLEQKKLHHLTALRTKYGAGMSGCTEQVITLVDYYRDFERRTDLSETWKAQITKLQKIESSLSEYVQFLNIPVALRGDFIKDLISYLRVSWRVDERHPSTPQ